MIRPVELAVNDLNVRGSGARDAVEALAERADSDRGLALRDGPRVRYLKDLLRVVPGQQRAPGRRVGLIVLDDRHLVPAPPLLAEQCVGSGRGMLPSVVH